jgi:hypothetical protein
MNERDRERRNGNVGLAFRVILNGIDEFSFHCLHGYLFLVRCTAKIDQSYSTKCY